MKFSLTKVGSARTLSAGGAIRPVNVADGECASTITTRYERIGPTNILSLAHFPMTVVLIEL